MIQKVTLPKLGQTVESATIETWVKQEGDPVAKGDVLCEITTDKATLEVESFHKGTLLKIVAAPGAELQVGEVIAVVGDPGDPIPDDLVAASAAAQVAPAEPEAAGATAEPAAVAAAERPAAPPAAAAGDVHIVTLPKLGQTVESAVIETWHKAEGDPVAKGDVLCEITTDKATLEVESYHAGTLLKIVVEAGAELSVGEPIAVVGEPGTPIPADLTGSGVPAAKAPATAPAATKAESPKTAPAAPARSGGRVFASPRARMRARDLGVELASVGGTGPGGRVVEADVLAAAAGAAGAAAPKATPLARRIAAAQGTSLAGVTGTGPGGKVTREDVLQAAGKAPAAVAAPAPGKPGEVVPLSPMRRIVAERMLHSKRTIPCYYLEMEIDVTELVCLRQKLNAQADGFKYSFTDFFLKACGKALAQFPAVNSRWVEGGIERRAEASVGFAVAIDEGLMVPVVRHADRKSLREINRETADLTVRARTKKLLPEEYQGGCMTITNLGMFGIRSFIPVVNPGESTIMGQGLIEDRVLFRQGGIQVRKMMTVTLAVDHRTVDGAVGAQFLEAIRDAIEAPRGLIG